MDILWVLLMIIIGFIMIMNALISVIFYLLEYAVVMFGKHIEETSKKDTNRYFTKRKEKIDDRTKKIKELLQEVMGRH